MVAQWLVKFDSTKKKQCWNEPTTSTSPYLSLVFSSPDINNVRFYVHMTYQFWAKYVCVAVDINFIAVASTIQFMPKWLTGWEFEILCNHYYFVSSSDGHIYCAPVRYLSGPFINKHFRVVNNKRENPTYNFFEVPKVRLRRVDSTRTQKPILRWIHGMHVWSLWNLKLNEFVDLMSIRNWWILLIKRLTKIIFDKLRFTTRKHVNQNWSH